MLPIYDEDVLEAWHAPTKDFCILVLNIKFIGTEYGLKTRFAPSDEFRLLALDIMIMGSKIVLRQLKKF